MYWCRSTSRINIERALILIYHISSEESSSPLAGGSRERDVLVRFGIGRESNQASGIDKTAVVPYYTYPTLLWAIIAYLGNVRRRMVVM